MRKVVDASDVLIEILDARDPDNCRSKEVEEQIAAAGKKLVLILNKIDLVQPESYVEKW